MFNLRLIGKRVNVMAEAYERISIENRRFALTGHGSLAHNFKKNVSSPTNNSSCRKSRINVVSYGIKKFGTVHAFDRQTGGRNGRLSQGYTVRRTVNVSS